MVRESARRTVDSALRQLSDLLTAHPRALDDLLRHLDHMSEEELVQFARAATWAQITLRQVIEDTEPVARLATGDVGLPGYPGHYGPPVKPAALRTPHCRQCVPHAG